MKNMLILAIVFTMLCNVSSCNDGDVQAAQIDAELNKQTFIADFCETDFTPVIENADVKYIEDYPEGEERWHFESLLEIGGVDPEAELTETEKMVLSEIGVGPGKFDHLSTAEKVYAYYDATGEMPESSEEILDYNWDDQTVQFLQSASLERKYQAAGALINPATGRLYANLRATEWAPFGCFIEIVPPEGWEEAVGSSELPEPEEYNGELYYPKTLFRFVRWGETEGKVLQDYYIWAG